MSTRRDIQNRIAEIERLLSAEVERAHVDESATDFRQFPGFTWAVAVFCLLWGEFGRLIRGAGDAWLFTHRWAMYLGGLLLLLAVWRTILWLPKQRRKVVNDDFRAATARSRELQAERRELKARLNELQD